MKFSLSAEHDATKKGGVMLEGTNILSPEGMERIFAGVVLEHKTKGGEVVNRYLRGFRLEDAAAMAARGIVIDEQGRTSPDSRGVYKARVTMQGVARRDASKSGFFPSHWTRAQVVSAIAEAYETRKDRRWGDAGKFCEGRTREGMKIVLELDGAGLVVDAMPIRAKVNTRTEARWKLKEGRIKSSRHVCGECKRMKVYVCPAGHGIGQPIGLAVYIERAFKRLLRRGLFHV